jgi:hypothetical protein
MSLANLFAGCEQVKGHSRFEDDFGQTMVVPDVLLHVCLIGSIAVAAVGSLENARFGPKCRPPSSNAIAAIAQPTILACLSPNLTFEMAKP